MAFFRRTVVAIPVVAVALVATTAAIAGAQINALRPPMVIAPAAVVITRDDNRLDNRTDFRADERRGEYRDHRGESPIFSYVGTVDRELFVVVRGRDVTTVGRDRDLPFRVRVNNGLPRSVGIVSLDVDEGRGNIAVVEQPSPRNGFQAVIRIQDPRGGADRYRFTAFWQDDRRDGDRDRDWGRDRDWDRKGRGDENRDDRGKRDKHGNGDDRDDRGGNPHGGYGGNDGGNYGGGYDGRGVPSAADRGALHWSGEIDDVAEIRIQGRRVDYIARSGAQLRNVRSDLNGAGLPRHAVDVIVERREGRGDVDLMQQPNARNDYTAVIRVNDSKRGAAFYDLAVRW